jgi:ribonuclease P protein component
MALQANHLKRKKDFELVFKRGKALRGKLLVLKFVVNEDGRPRVGIVVSKKISKKAVVRNKVRRRLQAAVKAEMIKIKKGADMILLALPGIEAKNFQEIAEEITRLFKKAKLIKDA